MAASTDAAITVLAWGNESRGDDAIGPILARRILALDKPRINVVEDHQLNIEHVLDIGAGVPILFIDASTAIDVDYVIENITRRQDESISTHSISPQALLGLYEQTLGEAAPDAYLLHVCGRRFELGEDLSDAANESLDRAWKFLAGIFAAPEEQWHDCLAAASSASPGQL